MFVDYHSDSPKRSLTEIKKYTLDFTIPNKELHERIAKVLFDHCCTCNGSGRNCALNKIKGFSTDFETTIFRPF